MTQTQTSYKPQASYEEIEASGAFRIFGAIFAKDKVEVPFKKGGKPGTNWKQAFSVQVKCYPLHLEELATVGYIEWTLWGKQIDEIGAEIIRRFAVDHKAEEDKKEDRRRGWMEIFGFHYRTYTNRDGDVVTVPCCERVGFEGWYGLPPEEDKNLKIRPAGAVVAQEEGNDAGEEDAPF